MRLFLLLFLLSQTLFSSTLYKTLSSNPSRLNPLLATDSASSGITAYLFNGLLKYDKNGNIVGDLAKSYEIKSETKIIFKLKKNVFWHDGEKFTAEDVLFTYDLLKLSSSGKSDKISTPIGIDFQHVKDVKAIDKYTIEVTYKYPYFQALEIWLVGMLPKHILKDVDNYMTAKFNKNPIGTGPYKLKRFELSKSIILEAFDNYHEHKPNIDTIHFSIVPDSTTNFYLLKKQKVDLNELTAMQLVKKVDADFLAKFKIIEKISNVYDYIGFNFKRKIFQDPRVREAVKLGINKKELVDILFFKHGQVCNGPFLPASFAYNSDFEQDTYDRNKSIELLKEAGYTKENPLTFELALNTSNPTRLAAAQIIQYQLEKVGIKIKLSILEWQAFLNTKVFAQDFDALLLGWSLSLAPDAHSTWHSDQVDKKHTYNFISYKNAEVDKVIIEIERTIDRKKLSILFKKLFALIVNDNPYIFLYIPNEIIAINKKISPIEKSIIGIEHNQIDWIKE